MKIQLIIVPLIIILLASACTIQKANLAGKINSTEIPNTEFMTAHRGHFQNFMTEKGRTPDSEEKKEILRQTWRNITIHVILKEHFKKYDISVSEQEVIDTLRLNIPAYLRNSPLLMVNGKFDKSLYLQSLEFNNPVNLTPVKRHYFEYLIPIQKLKLKLIDSTILTRKELKILQDIYSSRLDVNWVIFDPQGVSVTVSDNEIQAYYQSNLSSYDLQPTYQLAYSMIKVQPSQADIDATYLKADSLFSAIQKGESFTAMAEKYSLSETSVRGGNLGFVAIGELPIAVKQHLQQIENSQVAPPLNLDGKWHIFQVLERTRTMIRLREIVIEPAASVQTVEHSFSKAESLLELSKSMGLQDAATEMDYPYYMTTSIAKDTLWIADLAVVNNVKAQLRTAKTGALLEPVYSRKLSSWLVLAVINNQTKKFQSLASVKDAIAEQLAKDMKKEISRQIAERWCANNPKPVIHTVAAQNQRMLHTPNLGIGDVLLGNPVDLLIYHTIKNHRAGFLAPISHSDVFLVPIVHKLSLRKDRVAEHRELRNLYMNTLPSDWFENWLEDQIKNASVKIWQ